MIIFSLFFAFESKKNLMGSLFTVVFYYLSCFLIWFVIFLFTFIHIFKNCLFYQRFLFFFSNFLILLILAFFIFF
jgi:hypothetical protein